MLLIHALGSWQRQQIIHIVLTLFCNHYYIFSIFIDHQFENTCNNYRIKYGIENTVQCRDQRVLDLSLTAVCDVWQGQ